MRNYSIELLKDINPSLKNFAYNRSLKPVICAVTKQKKPLSLDCQKLETRKLSTGNFYVFTFFGTKRLFQKSNFSSDIKFPPNIHILSKLSEFLVGAFLGKSARLLQWLVFFLFFSSDYNLTLIGPLFLQSKLLKLA